MVCEEKSFKINAFWMTEILVEVLWIDYFDWVLFKTLYEGLNVTLVAVLPTMFLTKFNVVVFLNKRKCSFETNKIRWQIAGALHFYLF